MSADKNHSEDLINYLEGRMSSEEANAFERAALDDPFLLEAIEGAESISSEDYRNDLVSLNERFQTKKAKPLLWKVAASIALLAIAGFSIWFINEGIDNQEIAQNDNALSPPEADAETALPVPIDSASQREDQIIPEEAEEAEPLKLKPIAMAEEKPPIEVKRKKPIVPSPRPKELISDDEFETEELVTESLFDADDSYGDLEDVAMIKEEEPKASKAKRASQNRSKSFMKATGAVSRSASKEEPKRKLHGQVTDDFGDPLPSVTVIIFGEPEGTVTDIQGKFSLDSITDETLLNFSSIGMLAQDIVVGNRDTLDVKLDEDTQSLQEVVVVGYGVSEEPTKGFSSASPIPDFKSFYAYIEENLVYPEEAISKGIEGRVVLQLTISPIGTITDIEVKRGLGAGCDEEAIRLIRQGPRWSPATRDGRNTESSLRVRVKFEN